MVTSMETALDQHIKLTKVIYFSESAGPMVGTGNRMGNGN